MNSTPLTTFSLRHLLTAVLAAAIVIAVGCSSAKRTEKKNDFFTSGSREADQRASQRMAKEAQLSGTADGMGGKEKGVKKASAASINGDAEGVNTNRGAVVEGKLALFDRLGGEKGITAIIDDFTPRVLQDPRVNWQRKDVKGRFSLFHKTSASETWTPNDANVIVLKKHIVQFIVLATGGPANYSGKDIKAVHAGMHIGNPEFDAALGDLKASLDRLQVPNKEQKELLSVIESTRPQIVTER